MTLVAILVLPLLVSIVCWTPALGRRVASVLTLANCVALLGLAVWAAHQVIARGRVAGVPGWLELDALGALILLLVTAVAVTASLYSLGYMKRTTHDLSRLSHYYGNFNLFIFSMVAVPVVAGPSLAWLAVEFTTLLSVLLVGFEGNREALEAAWKYAILTLTGAAIALFGFLLLFWAMHVAGGARFTWPGLELVAPHMPPALVRIAYLAIMVGFGTKVGLVPLHTWLPDAHSQAPAPVCALLSGIETSAILYVILRLMPIARASLGIAVDRWAIVFGLVSVGVAAFLLIQVHDYKRLFAFSTVEQMGLILVAAGLGSRAAQYGAMYQIFAHAFTKSFCFLAAGAVLLALGTREIDAVRGLIRRSPGTAVALLLGGLAIAGAPPFAVFLGEFTILKAGIVGGHYLATGLLALFLAVAFFGILLHINRMVFGAPSAEAPPAPSMPWTSMLALLLAVAPVLIFGVYVPSSLHTLLIQAAGIVRG